ncbi:MAG TPA: arsinothricin resistance N-acetyltransferase ArsN1 family A [Solirubrobacteraceae bacterium]|nr:arsinothricin resistance N-acetyltransferase ArsN1 family A [Solirubrobacteraceae bacterium]
MRADPVTGLIAVRPAGAADAPAIARIYNQGIEDGQATFETALREPDDVTSWIADVERRPLVVAERDGDVVGWARVGRYSYRRFYEGVGEYAVYVERGERGAGAGRLLLDALLPEARRRGYYKLVGLLFSDNEATLALARRCGFREVGTHRRHGRLGGRWRDVVLVERLLDEGDCD